MQPHPPEAAGLKERRKCVRETVGLQWAAVNLRHHVMVCCRTSANLQKRFAEGPIDWKPFLDSLKGAKK